MTNISSYDGITISLPGDMVQEQRFISGQSSRQLPRYRPIYIYQMIINIYLQIISKQYYAWKWKIIYISFQFSATNLV